MAEPHVQRRLAAIVAADVVGFSKMMATDEDGTLARLKSLQAQIVLPQIATFHGRIFKTTGDGFLAEFPSVVNAVSCAVAIQGAVAEHSNKVSTEGSIQFRIGINLGDVIADGDDLFGDGVNVAARLEALAPPGGISVTGNVRNNLGSKLHYTFQDCGMVELKNIPEPVQVFQIEPQGFVSSKTSAAPVSEKPSIAVLPFQNISGDPSQDYFADGVVEEITSALSHMRWFFVIARNSSMTYKNKTVDVRQVGKELGVRYVVEGSVRQFGDKVRLSAQLIDTAAGNHVWSERYDGKLDEIFDLQDRVARSVAGAIQPSLIAAEVDRSRRKRPDSLAAHDFVMRAFPLVWALRQAANEEALALLKRALDVEPDYPLALALAAWCHAQKAVYNWTTALAEERTEALALAQKAAHLSSDDPLIQAILGAAYTVAKKHDLAEVHLDRALQIDPSSAWAWNRRGWLSIHQGEARAAIEQFEQSIRLSPLDPANFVCLFGIADAWFLLGEYEKCLEWCQRAARQKPDAYWHLRVLVPTLVYCDRGIEARRELEILMRHYPGLTLSNVADALPFSAEMMDRIVVGLRKAGLPE